MATTDSNEQKGRGKKQCRGKYKFKGKLVQRSNPICDSGNAVGAAAAATTSNSRVARVRQSKLFIVPPQEAGRPVRAPAASSPQCAAMLASPSSFWSSISATMLTLGFWNWESRVDGLSYETLVLSFASL